MNIRIVDPFAARASVEWAKHVCEAHSEAKKTQESLFRDELHIASLLVPRGNIFFLAGNPSAITEGLPPTIEMDVVPDL